jgi:hypothetical protein
VGTGVGTGRTVVFKIFLVSSTYRLKHVFLQMDSAPAEIREFLLKYHSQNKVIYAAAQNRIDILEWLRRYMPEYVTAKNCRFSGNFALRCAARNGHVGVLEWLHRYMPGGVTADDYKCENNYALRWAAYNGHMSVLEWLHKCIPGGFTAEDCRVEGNMALKWAAAIGHVAVLEWLATKLTLVEFEGYDCGDVWWRVQRQIRGESMLALVVAGKRKKIRLPPELWELVWELVEK